MNRTDFLQMLNSVAKRELPNDDVPAETWLLRMEELAGKMYSESRARQNPSSTE